MKIEENPERRRPKIIKTETKRTYTMPFWAEYYHKKSVRIPYAYLLRGTLYDIVEKLTDHGILVERLVEIPLDVLLENRHR